MKLYICETMDGYIARENGSFDFLDEYNELIPKSPNEQIAKTYEIFMQDIKNVVQGYTTYKQLDEIGFGDHYGQFNHYVLTNKHHDLVDPNVTAFVSLEELKALHLNGEETFLVGGSKVIQSCFKEQLITEMIIFKIPMFLTKGIKLFDQIDADVDLSIKEVIHDEKYMQVHYLVNYK